MQRIQKRKPSKNKDDGTKKERENGMNGVKNRNREGKNQ
jgi:hypothetical protein